MVKQEEETILGNPSKWINLPEELLSFLFVSVTPSSLSIPMGISIYWKLAIVTNYSVILQNASGEQVSNFLSNPAAPAYIENKIVILDSKLYLYWTNFRWA